MDRMGRISHVKRRRFPVEIILLCVRWYCKYGISYRDLTEMMQERGVEVDALIIMRWVHRYAPELKKRVRWCQGYRATSWRVDETYVKVGGRWKHLFRALISLVARLTACWPITAIRGQPIVSWKSINDHARLAAILDHLRPTRLLPEGDPPFTARGQAACRHQASNCRYLNNLSRAG